MLTATASNLVAASAPSASLACRRIAIRSMPHLLREYTTDDDLKEAVAFCTQRPQQFLLGYSAKYQLERKFPETKLRLFSNHGEPKFWFGYKLNQFVREMYFATMVDGVQLNEAEYEPLFTEFLAETGAFARKRMILFLGDSPITDYYCRLHQPTVDIKDYPCRMFYMNKEQQENVKHFQPSVPEGYEISTLEAERDADFVTSTWKHAGPAKLRNLPSACIRYKGQPVSFEMCDHIGPMNHLFTLKEHRGKRLGPTVENLLAQKLIEFGTTPFKYVELANTLATASTERSSLWSSMARDGKIAYGVYQVVDFMDWSTL